MHQITRENSELFRVSWMQSGGGPIAPAPAPGPAPVELPFSWLLRSISSKATRSTPSSLSACVVKIWPRPEAGKDGKCRFCSTMYAPTGAASWVSTQPNISRLVHGDNTRLIDAPRNHGAHVQAKNNRSQHQRTLQGHQPCCTRGHRGPAQTLGGTCCILRPAHWKEKTVTAKQA